MTDTTSAPQAAPSHETSASPTPVMTPPAGEPAPIADAEFDANWKDFLSHDFGDEPEPAPVPVETPAVASPTPAAPAGVAAPVDPAGAPSSPSPVQANGGLTPPATVGHEGTSPQVDPNLLMAMMGGATPAPAAAPQPATAPAQPAPAAPSSDAPWEPFAANFELPPALTEVLFRSEDPQQQGAALVNLLSSFGNAVAQVVEQRITTHHAPRMQEQFSAATTERQQAAAVHNDFYGTHKDLQPYTAIVKRAGEVFFQHNPTATWSPETRDKVAELARATAKQLGYQLTGGAPAAPAVVAPGNAAPNTPFVAGSARPESLGMPEDRDSPGAILDQLTAWA